MHLDMRLHSVLFLASSGLALANGLESNSTHSPSLTLAFSGSVDVAAPLPPIRIPGGVRIGISFLPPILRARVPLAAFFSNHFWLPPVEPITGGTFSGPALNAIVSGGLAFPSVLQNGTVQDASITIYGTTRDNAPFLVQVTGIGVPRQQFARVVSIPNCYVENIGRWL